MLGCQVCTLPLLLLSTHSLCFACLDHLHFFLFCFSFLLPFPLPSISPSQGGCYNSESILIFPENTEPHALAGTHISAQNHTEEGISWESDVSQLLGFRVNIYRLPPSEKKGQKSSVAHKDGKFPKSFEFFFFSSKLFPSHILHQLTSLPLVLRPASSNLSIPPQMYSLSVLWTHPYCLSLDTLALSSKHLTCTDALIPYPVHHKSFELMSCIHLTGKC